MKKKILAVVLAVATAFSMFGASLSASAAAAAWTEAYTTIKTLTNFSGEADPTNAAEITALANKAVAELDAINNATLLPANRIYAVDYNATKFSAYVTALNATAALTTSTTATAGELANAKAALASLKTAYAGMAGAVITGIYGATGERAATIAEYGDVAAAVKALNVADYKDGDTYTAASITALKTAITAVDSNASTPTSILQYRIAEYKKVMANLPADDTALATALTALGTTVEAAAIVLENRGDYAATATVDALFAKLAEAYDKAVVALYNSAATASSLTTANTNLNNAKNALAPYVVAGDKAALKALYNEATTLLAEGYTASAANAAAWGTAYGNAGAIVVTNAYKSYAQSEIDAAYEALAAQIALLNIVDALPSEKLALQEVIDKANKLVETDYYPSTWSTMIKNLDAASELLAREKATSGAIATAKTNLNNAINALVAKSVSMYEINSLIKTVNDPTTGLLTTKNKEGKTIAQVNALEKALASAQAKAGIAPVATKLQSKVDAAVAELKAAIEAYKTGKVPEAFEGWTYDKATGWSYLKDGEAVTGWMWDADYNAWFFMNDNGSMKTGWHWDATYGAWYYLNANGTMATNRWINDNGTWYYVYESGKMAVNTTINGYTVNASGAWVA